jgi:hypothetical protein
MNLGVFVLGGAILILAGVLQVFVRPRPAERGTGAGPIDAAVVRAVIFVVMGLLAVLVGVGIVPLAKLRF